MSQITTTTTNSQLYIKNIGVNLRRTDEQRKISGRITCEQALAFKKSTTKPASSVARMISSLGLTLQKIVSPH